MDAAGMDGWDDLRLVGGATVMTTDHVLRIIALAGWNDDDSMAISQAAQIVTELEDHGYVIVTQEDKRWADTW